MVTNQYNNTFSLNSAFLFASYELDAVHKLDVLYIITRGTAILISLTGISRPHDFTDLQNRLWFP